MITAVVSNGDLLIELEDGSVINAGRVQGPAGRDGVQGLSGFPGQEGRPGRDGKDGASIHTGLGVPETSDYNDGDLYIDVQTIDLVLYQKIGGQWARLGGLKGQPGVPGAAGANGAAGGGGSIIIDNGSNTGGDGPDEDNAGDPVNEGDLWFDPETGYIYVRMGSMWIAVSDHPPVIVSPTPPDYNNASDDGPTTPPKYPVKEGDLWYDSEQLALYVAALDADDDLVWLIAVPANRSSVDDEVAGNPFVLPANAVDRQEEYNPVTDTWYVYNAPKNQWIDFNPNDDPCLEIYGYILRYSDSDGPTAPYSGPFSAVHSFSFSIYSRTDYPNNRYDEHYLNDGDGNWQKIEDMDAATLAKYAIISVTEWQVNFWGPATTTGNWVAGLETTYPDMSVKGVATQKDDDGNDLVDENGDVISVESPAFRIYDDPCASFDVRDLDPTIASCGPGQEAKKRYLLAHGDDVADCTDPAVYEWNKPVTLRHGQTASSKSSVEISNQKITVESDKDMDVFAPNGEMTVSMDTGTLGIGGYPEMVFDYDGVKLVNDITESTDSKHVIDKKYSDAKDELLRQDIIELEEEINAIAPSLEYGSWKYEEPSGANATRPPASGTFFLIDGLGAVTHEYEETAVIKIHNNEFVAPGDTDPVDNHTWADADVGELIQLFDAADPDFFLGKITGKNVDPASESVTLTVDRIQSSGVPNDNADPVTGEFLTRVNIFKEPSGGTASDFVLKTGDEMSGALKFENQRHSYNYSNANLAPAKIVFENTDNDGNKRSTAIFHPGLNNGLAVNSSFKSTSSFFAGSGYFMGWDGTTDGGSTYTPRIQLTQNTGYLKHGTTETFFWDSAGIYLKQNVRVYKRFYLSYNSDCRLYAYKGKSDNTDFEGLPGQVLTSNGDNGPAYWSTPSTGSSGTYVNRGGNTAITLTVSGNNLVWS